MIGKGKAIAHTQASVAYGWNQEKGAEVVFKQELVGDSPNEITQEFKMVQDQNYHCQKNTLSFVISPTIEDGKQTSFDIQFAKSVSIFCAKSRMIFLTTAPLFGRLSQLKIVNGAFPFK